jgi:predicted MFS family arabinose efflux permease
LLGGVVYENLGMNAPLYITVIILLGMLAFTLRSRRLRQSLIVDQPPPEPASPA